MMDKNGKTITSEEAKELEFDYSLYTVEEIVQKLGGHAVSFTDFLVFNDDDMYIGLSSELSVADILKAFNYKII